MWLNPILNNDNESGKLEATVKVSSVDRKDVSVQLVMKDITDKVVLESNIALEEKDGKLIGFVAEDVREVKAWDNHNPYLYKTVLEVRSEDGEILEVVPYNIGFRRIEIINKVMYLNGKDL